MPSQDKSDRRRISIRRFSRHGKQTSPARRWTDCVNHQDVRSLVMALRRQPVNLNEVTSLIERNAALASALSHLSRTEQGSTAIAIVSLGIDALLRVLVGHFPELRAPERTLR